MTRYSEDVTLIPAARWTLLSAPVSHVSSRPGSLLCPPLCPSLCWSNPTFSFRKLFSSMTSLFHPTTLYNMPKHFSCRDLFYCQAMSSARIYFFFHTTDCLHLPNKMCSQILCDELYLTAEQKSWRCNVISANISNYHYSSITTRTHKMDIWQNKRMDVDRTKERLSTLQSGNTLLCATFLQCSDLIEGNYCFSSWSLVF